MTLKTLKIPPQTRAKLDKIKKTLSTKSRFDKKTELEILAEATTIKSPNINELQKQFKQNLSDYFQRQNISYRDLAKMMREATASPQFCYAKNLKLVIEGRSPITTEFCNGIGEVFLRNKRFNIVNLVPIRRRMGYEKYLDIAKKALVGDGIEDDPKEAIRWRLYSHIIGYI